MPKRNEFDQTNVAASLGVFIAITLGIGSAIGILSRPDEWYFVLERQVLVPPQWVLSIGMSVYFVALGIVGHFLWRRSQRQRHWRWSIWMWSAHTVFMWAVAPVLYVGHRPGAAVIMITIAAGLMFDLGVHTWRREPKMAPYIVVICLWLLFLMGLCFQFTIRHLANFNLG